MAPVMRLSGQGLQRYWGELLNFATAAWQEWDHQGLQLQTRVAKDAMPLLVRYRDWYLEFNIRFGVAAGSAPDPWTDPNTVVGMADRLRRLCEQARKDFYGFRVQVPSWAYDGIHVKAERPDPRFAGTPEGFHNGLLMYEKYRRLDPRDQGVTLQVGTTFWPSGMNT